MTPGVQQQVQQFFARYTLRHYKKGELLILSERDPSGVFYLEKGRVRQYTINHKGDEVVVNVFKAPSFFPMAWALNRSPNLYFYEAAEDTAVRIAPPDMTVAFLKEHPEVLLNLLQRVYRGIEGLLGRLTFLMGGTARNRLIHELIIEAHRFGHIQPDETIKLPINENDLGTIAGLTRETVNRELHKLKQEKLLSVRQRTIYIHDLSRLEKLRAEAM